MVQDAHVADVLDKEPMAGSADASLEEKRKKVGNYVILKTIGEGSFAKVRLGIHLITEMKVSRFGTIPFFMHVSICEITSSFSSPGSSESDQ